MNFSEQPPSKHWVALKYRGEPFADVWFKPEGAPFALAFRIPQQSFQIPGVAEQLTLANLLKAVAIQTEQVESWRHGDVTHSNGADLGNVLPPPPPLVTQLEIFVRVKQPPQLAARAENEISSANWQELEVHWKAILALEATVDGMRISMEGLLAQMESAFKKPLTTEEKLHAPRADIAQWTKARSRAHIAVPKMKDFIHRAVWAIAAPERKRLEEIHRAHIEPHIPFGDVNHLLKQLEDLRKDRQVLTAQGQSVYQECKGILADLQGTLRMLHTNAVANARKKKS